MGLPSLFESPPRLQLLCFAVKNLNAFVTYQHSELFDHIVIGDFSFIRTRAIVSALPFLCTNKVCSVDLHSIPDLLITRYMNINECMKRNECHRDGYPYLHPCVNDNREEADREYVEELEKLKQPHDEGGKGSVHFRPSYPGDCL